MLKDYIIYGLKDLLANESVRVNGGIEVLNNAIKLINKDSMLLKDIGCPNCNSKDELVCLGSVDDHKYYECSSCNTKIKVKVFKKIVDYKVK